MLIRVAEGRKLYINIQYGVIAMFATMNLIALVFILINCTPPEYDQRTLSVPQATLLNEVPGLRGNRSFLRKGLPAGPPMFSLTYTTRPLR